MKARLFLSLLLFSVPGASGAPAKSYQVTGPIVALTDDTITVQKGEETWEIVRTSGTKVDGKLAVGQRVTIYYTMSADRIEVKDPAEKSSSSSTEKADRAAQKAAERAEKKAGK
jgi:hypothetical protein